MTEINMAARKHAYKRTFVKVKIFYQFKLSLNSCRRVQE